MNDAYDKTNLKRAYNWFLEFMGSKKWDERRKVVIQYCKTIDDAGRSYHPHSNKHIPIAKYDDWFGWYLYLIESEIYRPYSGDPSQLSRIAPVFETIGRRLETIKLIKNLGDKVNELVISKRNQPDMVLFEILVASFYGDDGWDVEFVKERRKRKTPDILIHKGGRDVFVECKRLSKSGNYEEKERGSWLKIWGQLFRLADRNNLNIHVDIVFDEELHLIKSDEVANAFLHYWKSGKIDSGEVFRTDKFSFSVKHVNFQALEEHFENFYVKPHSPQMIKLLSGEYEWWCGYTNAIEPSEIVEHGDSPLYALNISYGGIRRAISAKWRCNAAASISKKAKDIIDRVNIAVEQLPVDRPGIIHVGYESLNGNSVESERLDKIARSLEMLDVKGKNIATIMCHAFENYSDVNEVCVRENAYEFLIAPKRSNKLICRPNARILAVFCDE